MPVSTRKCGCKKVAAGLPEISQRKPNVRKHRTFLEREDSGTGSPDRRCRHGLLLSAVLLAFERARLDSVFARIWTLTHTVVATRPFILAVAALLASMGRFTRLLLIGDRSLDSVRGLVVPSTPEPSSAVRSDRWFPAGSFNSSSDLHRESVPACGHSLEVSPSYVAGLLALLSRSVRARSVDGGRACRRDRSAG